MTNAKLALWLLLTSLANVVQGRLVFTEVMLSSPKAADPFTQWFEITNTEPTTVSLNEWQIGYYIYKTSGSFSDIVKLSTQKTIGPYGYVVIGNNANTASNGHVPVDIQVAFRRLPHDESGDFGIVLTSPMPNSIQEDSFRWSPNNPRSPGLNFTFTPGASLVKISAVASDAQAISSWKPYTPYINCDSGTDKGTPGKINTFACPTNAPTKAPTKNPTTRAPSAKAPTKNPTKAPTTSCPSTKAPKSAPAAADAPVASPVARPIASPVSAPVIAPTVRPVAAPNTAQVIAPDIARPVAAPIVAPAMAPVVAPVVSAPVKLPSATPTRKTSCGLFRLGILCWNSCGIMGRTLGMCLK